ncbi:MAG TPA: hypothetical protein VH350_00095 [Candidatus Sulfotelmatobacter sp.]|nr:hypothetical protein [Candidatus Sulfotelmatobacter sp.]
MTRINALRSIAETRSMTWGKNTSALIFAAVLIVCSVTVGCSSDKPKPASSNNQPTAPQPQPETATAPTPAPVVEAAAKPAPRKVARKKPATVNYTDKTYGVAFEYSRRYAIETGNAATELLASNPIAMNFVQPGGVALAAVELPETGFANTDFSSAFFNVSVHKSLTPDQCTEFAVPQPKAAPQASTTDAATAVTPVSSTATPASETQSSGSKLMLGDLELRATEAVTGEGTRQSDSKYFHVFQNGACYEFALNVTTVASEDGVMNHVDRDKVFDRLEKILATVKINPVAAPEVTAEAPTQTQMPAPTPAQ